jgi:hypothetical protein
MSLALIFRGFTWLLDVLGNRGPKAATDVEEGHILHAIRFEECLGQRHRVLFGRLEADDLTAKLLHEMNGSGFPCRKSFNDLVSVMIDFGRHGGLEILKALGHPLYPLKRMFLGLANLGNGCQCNPLPRRPLLR